MDDRIVPRPCRRGNRSGEYQAMRARYSSQGPATGVVRLSTIPPASLIAFPLTGLLQLLVLLQGVQMEKSVFIVSAVSCCCSSFCSARSYTKAKSSINRRKQPSRTKLFSPASIRPNLARRKPRCIWSNFLIRRCGTCRDFYPLVKDLMKAKKKKG